MLTITDDTGRQIRRMDVDKNAGLRRVAWNLRTEPPAGAPAGGGRGGGGGGGGQFGGRGGAALGTLVAPGTYRATLRQRDGDASRRSVRAAVRSGWCDDPHYERRVRGRGSRGYRCFDGTVMKS